MQGEVLVGLEATQLFFDNLSGGVHEPALADVEGTVLIEVTGKRGSRRWLVVMDKGHVTATPGEGEGECSLRVDQELFEQAARGEANLMAAALRGLADPSGELDLLLALQRLFPGPADQQRPAPIGRSTRWTP